MAALFPMVPDEELHDLADDIKANGLIHPIVIDTDGQLIDGRNRLRACELAGVEPAFEQLGDHDPVAYILSSNVNRRHMSKGQLAMVVAQVVLKNNTSQAEAAKTAGMNRSRVVHASTVLTYAPDLTDAVMAGSLPLSDAYAEARTRKIAAESTDARMARLRAEAPDLADQVVEERLTLVGALAELGERTRRRNEDITIISDRLSRSVKVALDLLADAPRRERAIALFSDDRSFLDEPLTAALLNEAAENLGSLAKEWTR